MATSEETACVLCFLTPPDIYKTHTYTTHTYTTHTHARTHTHSWGCHCSYPGLKDGVPVKDEDVPSLVNIVNYGLGAEATKELVASCIASRPQRVWN
jgi:hypothetical protein